MKIIFIITAVLSLVATGCSGCDAGYSDGDRSGVVTKLSYKGLVCKSWEGEMNLGGLSTDDKGAAVPNVWRFTVVDTAQVAAIQNAMKSGKRVNIHYTQWAVSPYCQDSDYEAQSVSVVP
jgi:hypothetical protein